jgi:hypothetical protein
MKQFLSLETVGIGTYFPPMIFLVAEEMSLHNTPATLHLSLPEG